MLSFRSAEGAALQIDIRLDGPGLYLDYSVLADFSMQKEQQGVVVRRLLIDMAGTLYLSWAHLIELFGLGDGPTYRKIRAYIDSFGPNFLLIDSDSGAVINREKDWSVGKQNPAVDEQFMIVLARNWDGMRPMSPGILLDKMATETGLFGAMKQLQASHRIALQNVFDPARTRYRSDAAYRKRLDSARYDYSPPGFTTEKVRLEITRETIRTNEAFTPSDGLDFEHTVVSVAYCTIAVLDKKWARRCRRLDMPKGSARILDGTESDALIEALEGWNRITRVGKGIGPPNNGMQPTALSRGG